MQCLLTYRILHVVSRNYICENLIGSKRKLITSSDGNVESPNPLFLHKSLLSIAPAHVFCSQVQHLMALHSVPCSSPPDYEPMCLINCCQTHLLSVWCLVFSHLQNPRVGLNASLMHKKDGD